MKMTGRWLVLFAALALVAVACGDDDSAATTVGTSQPAITTTTAAPGTTAAPATTAAPDGDLRTVDAVEATITVDGDPSDWAGIDGIDIPLDPIKGEEHIAAHTGNVKVAYDADNVYVMFTVDDDFNWTEGDGHLSASSAVMWAINDAAGTGMGSDAEGGDPDDNYNSLGVVDIWHWELECAAGVDAGGAVSEAGADNDPGNDAGCNFDDEWSTDPKNREDDNGDGAENSLLGVYSHTNPVADGDGTWFFEMSRPLQTGDSTDAQFASGGSYVMAVAYWDADNNAEGWDDDEHVNSATRGWIQVNF